jgi:hypothetical protein
LDFSFSSAINLSFSFMVFFLNLFYFNVVNCNGFSVFPIKFMCCAFPSS